MVYRVCSRGESLLRRNAQSCYTCFQFYSTRPVFGIRIAPGAAVELAARKLRDEALDKGSMDNISVMVTLLRPIPQHPNEVLAFFSGSLLRCDHLCISKPLATSVHAFAALPAVLNATIDIAATQEGQLGIIFGDDWPCIKRITDDSLAAEQPQVRVLTVKVQPKQPYPAPAHVLYSLVAGVLSCPCVVLLNRSWWWGCVCLPSAPCRWRGWSLTRRNRWFASDHWSWCFMHSAKQHGVT